MMIKFSTYGYSITIDSLIFIGMQQTVVEYIDPTLKAQVEEDILTLLGLTHSDGQRLTSPHHQSLSEAENHTV